MCVEKHQFSGRNRDETAGGGRSACWTAQALLTNGELITDTTLPNCKS
jgi:hypothetical protein